MSEQIFTGTVSWFNDEKGFGFIGEIPGRTSDLFVHYSGIEGDGRRTLLEGEKVEFEIKDGRKGPEATRVRVIE